MQEGPGLSDSDSDGEGKKNEIPVFEGDSIQQH